MPGSPSYHYLAEVFIPVLRKLGLEVRLNLAACGFYPKGGGRITARISPATEVAPLHAAERGKLLTIDGFSAVGNLPVSIAERQKIAFLEVVRHRIPQCGSQARIEAGNVSTPGRGTFLFCRAGSEHAIAGFTALGELGKGAEAVGEEAARDLVGYCASGAALDAHLADQLVLYLSLSSGRSMFTTSCITRHLLTNLWAVGLFHDFTFTIKGEAGAPGTVVIN